MKTAFLTLTLTLFSTFSSPASADEASAESSITIAALGGVSVARIHKDAGSDGVGINVAARAGYFVAPNLAIAVDLWAGNNELEPCDADASCWNDRGHQHRTLTGGLRLRMNGGVSFYAGAGAVYVPAEFELVDSVVTPGAVLALSLQRPLADRLDFVAELRYATFAPDDVAVSNVGLLAGVEFR